MFFDKLRIILFLDRNKLTIFESGKREELDIPKSISSFLTIIDSDGYEKLLADFFVSFHFNKQKAILILSKDIIFAKKINNTEDSTIEEKSFFSKVPLEEATLVQATVNYGDSIGLFAGSNEMFEPLMRIAEKNGLEIISVIPAIIYENLTTSEDLNVEVASQILNNEDLFEEVNFLKQPIKQEENQSGTKDNNISADKPIWYQSKKNRVMIATTIIMFLTAGGLTTYAFRSYLPFAKQPQQTSLPVEAVIPLTEASSSAQINYTAKENLKIEIYNGTGTAGLAARVRVSLVKLGFNNIETADVEGTGDKDTIFLSKTTVRDEFKTEILDVLNKTFRNVSQATSSGSTKFDIEITTGALK